MPGKPKTNHKALEARERKETQKQAVKSAKEKAEQDALWADEGTDKGTQRKKEQEVKRQAELEKRKAKAEILAKDEEAIKAKNAAPPKVTQVQILQAQTRAREIAEEEQRQRELAKQKLTTAEVPAPNVNRPEPEDEKTDWVTSFEELSVELKGTDKHPEKRLRAAFRAYTEENMPVLKQENPTLKLSQLKELLWKQWQKSPQNPLNQAPSAD